MNNLKKLRILCVDARRLQDSKSTDGSGHATERAANAVFAAGLGVTTLYASLDAKEYALTAMRMHRTQKGEYAKHYHRLASNALKTMINEIQILIDKKNSAD